MQYACKVRFDSIVSDKSSLNEVKRVFDSGMNCVVLCKEVTSWMLCSGCCMHADNSW